MHLPDHRYGLLDVVVIRDCTPLNMHNFIGSLGVYLLPPSGLLESKLFWVGRGLPKITRHSVIFRCEPNAGAAENRYLPLTPVQRMFCRGDLWR